MIITTFKNEKIVKRYKIGKSIFGDGYRILVDAPFYDKRNEAVLEMDGRTEKLFPTRELAAEFVFNQIDKSMIIGVVDRYSIHYI